MFNNANQHINVYGDDVEVDYRGYEVTKLVWLVAIPSFLPLVPLLPLFLLLLVWFFFVFWFVLRQSHATQP